MATTISLKTVKIDNALATEALFLSHIAKFRPAQFVGLRESPIFCPVATFLKDYTGLTPGYDFGVFSNSVEIYKRSGFGVKTAVVITLPEWARIISTNESNLPYQNITRRRLGRLIAKHNLFTK